MIQDAPLSGVELSVPLLVRMAREIEMVKLFKIECPQAANKLRALIEQGGEAIEGPFDGEEAITLMADLQAGASGSMTSAMIPDQIKPVIEYFLAGKPDQAASAYARVLPAINFENRQCGFRATKVVMEEGESFNHPSAGIQYLPYIHKPRPACSSCFSLSTPLH